MKPKNLVVLIKGGGEVASGVAHRLFHAHFWVCLTEISHPQAVRREVSFCEAVYDGEKEVEGVVAKLVSSSEEVPRVWREGKIPLIVDPQARIKEALKPDILVDATMAKRNLGTRLTDAALVIGLGPGFRVEEDVHLVIETNRGHNLGRVLVRGEAEHNTGIPGEIGGVSLERVLRSPKPGRFSTTKGIGDYAQAGDIIAYVNGTPVKSKINGVIRGLLKDGIIVNKMMKIGDIDPRGTKEYCYAISDKSRAISGGVLEAIMRRFNVQL